MLPVKTTCVLITCFHIIKGKFFFSKKATNHTTIAFSLSDKKTTPVNFTSEQIFFETANRKLTALTSCSVAISGKQISEQKRFLRRLCGAHFEARYSESLVECAVFSNLLI
jgi:hypothetical protein